MSKILIVGLICMHVMFQVNGSKCHHRFLRQIFIANEKVI